MPSRRAIWRIVVPVPVYRVFDYLPPVGPAMVKAEPGCRVRVPFGSRYHVGLLIGFAEMPQSVHHRLKAVAAVLDETPIIPASLLQLLTWASGYYHHPLGEVLLGVLPGPLRRGRKSQPPTSQAWQLSDCGKSVDLNDLSRAPRQYQVMQRLRDANGPLPPDALNDITGWRAALRALAHKGYVVQRALTPEHPVAPSKPHSLNPAQRKAVAAVCGVFGGYRAFLLDGVTGSGKTEVYLALVEHLIPKGLQALVLTPEIGLTPQLVRRFKARFGDAVYVLHSGLSDGERVAAWLAARDGRAQIVIGTRSAVFVPLIRPGLIIVDEEHDLSYKQQDGFRYAARDMALMRAKRAGVPIVLGSATPSLETLQLARQKRLSRLQLPDRAGPAVAPCVHMIDLRGQPVNAGLTPALNSAIKRHLLAGGQVLLFINRRGYATRLVCHGCGWIAECSRCDARLTVHRKDERLSCHHCGQAQPLPDRCTDCGHADLRFLGKGTERLEERLNKLFPDAGVLRFDRDSTRGKHAMDNHLKAAREGRYRILVGTQMLAKGHDLPDITLVGIINADQGLYGVDIRSAERMSQLIIQVAGRAGRGHKPGEVYLQTYHPDHPLLARLLKDGYAGFVQAALKERRIESLPPFSHLALLRAEATKATVPDQFLGDACKIARGLGVSGVDLIGPFPAAMVRRAGRYRALLLLRSKSRRCLQALLSPLVEALQASKYARRVRWSIDVDPQETV